jgi:amino acid adenylation domain-containing protein/non-ribosomal peptide synthase protein (TIGR01720 family)
MTYYPLTQAQKRIWYIEKIYADTSLYNIGGPIRIKGPVDFALLEEAINVMIRKHAGIRLRLIETDGEPMQYVSEYNWVKLDYKDFSACEDPEKEFKGWVEKEAGTSFVLDGKRLFYFALFRISENDNGFLSKLHHIISDGWSLNIMTWQIYDAYIKLLKGEPVDDNPEPSYIDYIEQEQKYLASERYIKNKLFWNEKFRILPEMFLNSSSDIIEGNRRTYTLDTQKSSAIKTFAEDSRCSLNTFFVLLYLVYLNKTTLQEDIVIGTPVLNRSGKKEKSMFGMFTSTMPFRFNIDNTCTFSEAMVKVSSELAGCYFNQKYPYQLLVQDLALKKKGYDNLFNVCVNYYNTRLGTELGGLPLENVEFYNGKQIYSLQLVIKDWNVSGSLILDFDYKVNDYTAEQIDGIYGRLNNLIDRILLNPNQEIGKIDMLSEEEKKRVVFDINATEAEYPRKKTITQLFEEQTDKTPERTAISFNDIAMTYRELNEKANDLARFLRERGVCRESVVGILTTHSIETVVGILGILKAGGTYLPIDPAFPAGRIGYMLKDSEAGLLLVNYDTREDLDFKGQVVNLNDTDIYFSEKSNLENVNTAEDLAYIIYTSGSTGMPKGTMIEHRSLVNYIWWAKEVYIKDEIEVFPLYSSLAFDLTVTSVFTPLISGGRIVVYRDDGDEYVLYRIIKDNKATVVKLTPAHLALLRDMDNRASSVKRFIAGGEDLKVSLSKSICRSFAGNIEIYNEYGPTETAVGCMIHKYDEEKDVRASVPIGIPAHNVEIYILDKSLNPVPPGVTGEMYISGDGVARGYLNQPELTAERFIANPFLKNKRMYKTGDLARFLSSGNIEYVGRADQQVKIRGYRIEPAEIEKHILSHKAVRDAVVIEREGNNSSSYLCAYIVKNTEISIVDLKNYLLNSLPEYMIPLYFIALEKITLTSNGKVDRALLPEPETHRVRKPEFTEFRNEKEEILFKILVEILAVENICMSDNFFHLGGDSIKAIQVSSRLKNKGFRIKVKEILSHPVVEEMLTCIEQEEDSPSYTPKPCEGGIKPIPIVSWFLGENFKNSNHYTQSVLLDFKHGINSGELGLLLDELIKHHDALSINYDTVRQMLYYNNPPEKIRVESIDLAGYSYEEQKLKIAETGERLKSEFDIQKGLLIKACIFELGLNGRRLLLTAHHLIVDGVSWRILLEDMAYLLRRESNSLPSKTCSLQEWAEKLGSYSKDAALKELGFWKSVSEEGVTVPADFASEEDTMESSDTKTIRFTIEETESALISANTAYGTEVRDLLVTALAVTVFNTFGMNEAVVELEGHGREEILNNTDISRTVGWFTSIYPVILKKTNAGLPSQIKAVKEQLRKIPNNGMGYGVLKYLSKVINDSIKKKFIRFNYLGDFSASFDSSLFTLSDEDSGTDCSRENHMTSLLDINALVADHQLRVSFTYSRNKFSEETVEAFIKTYTVSFNEIIDHCCKKNNVEFTPSDFETVDISQDELDGLFF